MHLRYDKQSNLLCIGLLMGIFCNSQQLTMEDPTATPKLKVSLSFIETVTAVTCSVES